MTTSRRRFLKFIGAGPIALQSLALMNACSSTKNSRSLSIPFIAPTSEDDLKLAAGLNSEVLLKWGDTINIENEKFGYNNDYIAFIPLNAEEGILWVNHEATDPRFVSGYNPREDKNAKRTKAQIDKEQLSVGGSLVHIRKDSKGSWKKLTSSPYNRRITAKTPLPLIADRAIAGSKTAIGTLANCAGGVTPWNTILTCEENYDNEYGEIDFKTKKRSPSKKNGWDKFYNYSPLHYGWVVEINPLTGEGKKLTALGRFSHECATPKISKNNTLVVYSGDDRADKYLYKFIADKNDSLEKGTLYVANLEKGEWISLDIKKQPALKKVFKDQTEVLCFARDAAKVVGGTMLNRPEDIEIHPRTGDVYVSLTNNKSRGDYHGSILKISENAGEHSSLKFNSEIFLAGGNKTGFSCPDNFVFDKNGNLWMTTDISGSSINKPPYKKFQNNGLFYIPTSGDNAGEVFQIASAPVDAEFTGPCFSPDYKTLFLSVQHPGEKCKSLKQLTSNWPDGGNSIPKSSVVQISGKSLDYLVNLAAPAAVMASKK